MQPSYQAGCDESACPKEYDSVSVISSQRLPHSYAKCSPRLSLSNFSSMRLRAASVASGFTSIFTISSPASSTFSQLPYRAP